MSATAVVHFEVTETENGPLRRFYGILFGAQVQPSGIYYEVSDLQESLSLAEELGGTILTPVQRVAELGARFAFVADPAGNVVGLSRGLRGRASRAGRSTWRSTTPPPICSG